MVGAADPWKLRLEMVNEGVAPPYHIYPIAIKLESEAGQAWVQAVCYPFSSTPRRPSV